MRPWSQAPQDGNLNTPSLEESHVIAYITCGKRRAPPNSPKYERYLDDAMKLSGQRRATVSIGLQHGWGNANRSSRRESHVSTNAWLYRPTLLSAQTFPNPVPRATVESIPPSLRRDRLLLLMLCIQPLRRRPSRQEKSLHAP